MLARRTLPVFAVLALAAVVIAAGPWRFAGAQVQPAETALRAAEWASIRQVIGDQLSALKAGDGRKAMSFASPGIREQFGTPENFIAMVRNGYEALISARYTEFLDGAVVDGIVVQPLRLIAPDNSVLVALYTMEKQRDGRWRVAGCVLAPTSVRTA